MLLADWLLSLQMECEQACTSVCVREKENYDSSVSLRTIVVFIHTVKHTHTHTLKVCSSGAKHSETAAAT